ncbi:MAG TPA: 4Fe-4S dicluster domain-containing protein [Vicinamibacteria bacterium]|nr:4Fe-4S dicluster domain-containing protein [Vicinamibacteria bacterium]
MAELIPAPFPSLLRRMLREHEREGKIFDLPARKFWHGDPDLDTHVTFHGRPAANPLGPAAGPQDQMAQNIVLAWLAGSRILELKTVQVNDRLTIPRPCIDATTVGYNVEWSQELRLRQSLGEYVAGSMLVDILRAENLTGLPADRDRQDTILDMSVGYDLAGIRTPQVRGWIAGMMDASAEVAALRDSIPDDLKRYRDVPFTTRLSDQITLSTFHGCPASEIEGIVRFLLLEMGVHVTVKLNPTLLGKPAVDGLLHDVMGYHGVRTRDRDFANDLQWEQALEITDRLDELARSLGRTFQVKFSNTLVVENHRSFFPASEAVMYLSGPPLHVITLNLVEKFRRARPHVPISFSAGVDAQNFANCVALGFTPITTCTDLLRPGGYGRLPAYLLRLEERMKAAGARTIGDFVVRSCGNGAQALAQAVPDPAVARVLEGALAAPGADLRAALAAGGQEAFYDALVARAALLNTATVVAATTADPRYRAEEHAATPRKIGSRLWLFDCINCDKCIPVCPNDANFSYETAPFARDVAAYVVRQGRVVSEPDGVFAVKKAHQLANFQDFCNECGNCDVFCPEDGGPFIEKPRFFGSLHAFRELRGREGFFVERADGTDRGFLRHRGREYALTVDRASGHGTFTDGAVVLEVDHAARQALSARIVEGAAEGHRMSESAYLNLALAVDGALDTRRANPVNAPWLG